MAKVKTHTWPKEPTRRVGKSEDLHCEYQRNVREQKLPEAPAVLRESEGEHGTTLLDAGAIQLEIGFLPDNQKLFTLLQRSIAWDEHMQARRGRRPKAALTNGVFPLLAGSRHCTSAPFFTRFLTVSNLPSAAAAINSLFNCVFSSSALSSFFCWPRTAPESTSAAEHASSAAITILRADDMRVSPLAGWPRLGDRLPD
jgi:hypothetical protein